MKNAILLTLAAAVATVPAILGVTGNTTFSQSIPASIPSGASVVPNDDDKGHDSRETEAATASATSGDDRGRGSNDATATAAATGDNRGRGSDDATATTTADRQGRGSDDGATAAATTRVTVNAATGSTVDNRGGGADSGGHGGGSDSGGSGKR